GPVKVNGFQDRRNRPLCQLSAAKVHLFSFLQRFKLSFMLFRSYPKGKYRKLKFLRHLLFLT
ncbi:MAG: hypothetical protein ACLFPE_05890, partial [Bacteroidales bacterium]